MGKQWKQWETLFSWAPESLQMVIAAMKLKDKLRGRKAMTNLDSILKNRDITLLTKVHLIKAMIFPVVMHGCESWTIKKAEHRRIDAFELWCWKRFLRVSWTSRRSNQSILKEISPENSMEGLMLKLKFQSFGHLMWRTDSLEKTLMLGKIERRRRRGQQRMRWLSGITNSWTWVWASSRSCWWTGKPGVLQSVGLQRVGHDWATELIYICMDKHKCTCVCIYTCIFIYNLLTYKLKILLFLASISTLFLENTLWKSNWFILAFFLYNIFLCYVYLCLYIRLARLFFPPFLLISSVW